MSSSNKVTLEQINRLLDAAETEEHVFWGKELLVSYRLPSGFTVTGRAAVVDPSNFDIEKGREIARESAENQMWLLEGYLLQHKLNAEQVATRLANHLFLDRPQDRLQIMIKKEDGDEFTNGRGWSYHAIRDECIAAIMGVER